MLQLNQIVLLLAGGSLLLGCTSEAESRPCPTEFGSAWTERDASQIVVGLVDPSGVAGPETISETTGIGQSDHAVAMVDVVRICSPSMAVRSFPVGSGDESPTIIDGANAIRAAVDANVDVILVGFGSPVPHLSLEDAVNYAEDHQIAVVAPAGNSRQPSDELSIEASSPKYEWNEITYPAAYSTVVAVGALNADLSAPADFSQARSYVDVVAVGVNVVQIRSGGFASGTSFATPQVAVAMGLLRLNKPTASIAEVRDDLFRRTKWSTKWYQLPVEDQAALGQGKLNL